MSKYFLTYCPAPGAEYELELTDLLSDGLHTFRGLHDGQQNIYSAAKVLSLIDSESGEIINPWTFVANSGNLADGRPLIDRLLWEISTALKWLVFYAHTIQKTRQRHFLVVAEFANQSVPLAPWSVDNVVTHLQHQRFGDLQRYLQGDLSEYHWLLKTIPTRHHPLVDITAHRLLSGSRKRRPPSDELARLSADLKQMAANR